MSGIKIRATGRCVPERVLTNDDLSKMVDTNDEWIVSRTGIHRRHICTTESPLELCVQAAKTALEKSDIDPNQIGACIVATLTPENLTPSTACMIQQALGLSEDIPCFDLNAACSGFVFALHTMECLLSASERKFGLVIGGEALSRIVNWEDRASCILFGDGAGAVIVESREDWPSIGAIMGSRGDDQLLHAPGPGSKGSGYLSMEGTKVFKFAVEVIPQCIRQELERHDLQVEDIDQFVLHQANTRILDSVAKKCGIPKEKLHENLDEYGNTSAASIPLVLSELEDQGRLQPGAKCLLVGFGGGLTWGAALIGYAGKL